MHTSLKWFAALAAFGLLVGPAYAAPATSVVIHSGDAAWLLSATALVTLMSTTGLALFYGGLVRTKNALSMLAQVFAAVCLSAVIWLAYGYSVVFTPSELGSFVGGLSKAFLMGVRPESVVPTFTNGVVIPELSFVAFQMAFACITPAVIVGAFAERMRFPALLLFVALWVTLVYIPICHMEWAWPGPDALAAAAQAVTDATTGDARNAALAQLARVKGQAGLFSQWGAIDFAGGIVVHITAGVAGLVGAIVLGKRVGYGRDNMAPHSLTLAMTGAALLWVGWIGFNGGSALRADGRAALAVINTLAAGATGAMAWMTVEWMRRGKPSLLGIVSGVLSGLVAVTPGAGYIGPGGAMLTGLIAGVMCFGAVLLIKSRFDYDDSLDVFGVHCVAGVLGSILVAILANPRWGGMGIIDYLSQPGIGVVAAYDTGAQLLAQMKAVIVAVVWSALVSSRLYRLVDMMVGLRLEEDDEDQGLDLVDHGERAYNT